MEPTAMPGHEEARNRLLEEGAQSYLEAYTALLEYQREVQKLCRKAMEMYLDDYSSALGLGQKARLKSSDIRSMTWPKPEEWEGKSWNLGVEIVRKNIPGCRWWETYCCLSYGGDDLGFEHPDLYCWIGEWFPTRKMAANVYQHFHQMNPKVRLDAKEVWIHRSLTAEERVTFDDTLGSLLEQWIALWKKVGGVKEVFKA